MALFLGRAKEDQMLENIGPEITGVYRAEDFLEPGRRDENEADLVQFFTGTAPR